MKTSRKATRRPPNKGSRNTHPKESRSTEYTAYKKWLKEGSQGKFGKR